MMLPLFIVDVEYGTSTHHVRVRARSAEEAFSRAFEILGVKPNSNVQAKCRIEESEASQ